MTRGEFALALPRLTRIAGAIPYRENLIATSDVASSRAVFQDVQLVLGYGLLSPDKAEKFGADEPVADEDAVNAGVQLAHFPKSFQQARP